MKRSLCHPYGLCRAESHDKRDPNAGKWLALLPRAAARPAVWAGPVRRSSASGLHARAGWESWWSWALSTQRSMGLWPVCFGVCTVGHSAPVLVGRAFQSPRWRKWSNPPSPWTLPPVARTYFSPNTSQRNWRGFVNSLCHGGICLISCLSPEALCA